MIAQYEDAARDAALDAPRIYGLNLRHKHLPEMQKIAGLLYPPVFNPVVDDYYKGMATTLMLHNRLLNGTPTAAACDAAAHAIMTTDTVKKETAVETVIGGKTVRIGGIAKGSGMIHPNMGTMFCFLTTDCAVSPELLKAALLETANVSFNRISVDGDTSTNDSCIVLANGLAGNMAIAEKGEDYEAFLAAMQALCTELAKKMASDGEGAKHLITCTVSGSASVKSAETIAKSVISSTLTKAAIFGADANWGRVLCAMGYSGENFDPN